MDHTEERQRSFAFERAERTTFAFAAFVFAHAECEGEIVEFRLGENAVACWCPRCGELRAFGPADESPLLTSRPVSDPMPAATGDRARRRDEGAEDEGSAARP